MTTREWNYGYRAGVSDLVAILEAELRGAGLGGLKFKDARADAVRLKVRELVAQKKSLVFALEQVMKLRGPDDVDPARGGQEPER